MENMEHEACKKPRDRIFLWAMFGLVLGLIVGPLFLALLGIYLPGLHWSKIPTPGPNIGFSGIVGLAIGLLVGIWRYRRQENHAAEESVDADGE
jgi:hypothetical protein